MMLCVAVGCAQGVEHYRWQSELDASNMYVERSAGAKKLSCRSTFTEPGCPKLSGQAGISYVRGVGKELGVSDLQNGRATVRKSARHTCGVAGADGTYQLLPGT